MSILRRIVSFLRGPSDPVREPDGFIDTLPSTFPLAPQDARPHDQAQRNETAFLAALRAAEGTALMSDPYRVCFGYQHTVRDLSDHPAVTGEWRGHPLPDHLCRAAGYSPGCVSTAAGAYQFIRPTWVRVRDKLRLPDFRAGSQDLAALYLIAERGALPDVHAGRFEAALARVAPEWASLPGAGYGQPERSLRDLRLAYLQAGGVIA